MWMMGYNDGGDFNVPDSCNSRGLRPLFPRTLSSVNITSTPPPPRLPGSDLFALNHHLATIADQGKREFNTQSVVVSSRWNPTPEQLRTLEELYRRGARTPSAEQIQNITAQLRRYGKIEGKNVFYWFQNHKARERQKRRRQMESASDHEQNRDMEILERKESGYEGEQTKYWLPSRNCSTLSQESVSVSTMATKTAMAECRADGWTQFDERELQIGKNINMERNATWEMTTRKAMGTTVPSTAIRTMDANFIKAHDHLRISIAPYEYEENEHGLVKNISNSFVDEENGCQECSQTLQLFPLRSSGDGEESIDVKETEITVASAMSANLAPCQFFEFLPLKN